MPNIRVRQLRVLSVPPPYPPTPGAGVLAQKRTPLACTALTSKKQGVRAVGAVGANHHKHQSKQPLPPITEILK